MSNIIKLRRGTENTMKTVKSNTILAAGELFAEVPNTGVGTGKGRLVMGDGVTTYGNLPSFIENTDVSTAAITITADSSTTSTTALNNVSSGTATGALIGSLKQAISLTKTELTNNIDNTNTNMAKINTYVGTDGKIHFTNSAGADSVLNFSKGATTITISGTLYGIAYLSNGAGDSTATSKAVSLKLKINENGTTSIISGAATTSLSSSQGNVSQWGWHINEYAYVTLSNITVS